MRRHGPGRAGFGLVEVIVALAIVAVNVVGWIATLQLVFLLLRHMAELAADADPGATAAAACGLALCVPRRRGITLVELLVALALGAIVLGGLTAAVATTTRAARAATTAADAASVRAALPAMLQDLASTAGRGLDAHCGLATSQGGASVTVRRALPSGSLVEETVFAARDGGGRPALFLRRAPHARQPWVEDVTDFVVERVEREAGVGPAGRAVRMTVRVSHAALVAPLSLTLELPHRPCVEVPL